MRVAVLILALCLAAVIGLHLYGFGVGGPFARHETLADTSDIAVLLAVDLVLGAAFVIGFPRFSGLLFVLGGALAIAEGTTKGTSTSTAKGAGAVAGMVGHVSALQIWGGAALVLGLLAFVGARELGQGRQAVSDWTPQPQPQPGSASSGYRARPNPLVSVLAFLFIAALVLVGGGFVNLTGHSGSLGNAAVGNGTADGTGDDASVEGEGEVEVAPPASADTAFTDASGRHDDAAASEAPAVTKAWLIGKWGPLPSDGDRLAACETDDSVRFARAGTYYDGAGHGRFHTDGRTIVYDHRVLVDVGSDTEDRSQYDQPLTTHVTAVDANTLSEDDATFVRCPND